MNCCLCDLNLGEFPNSFTRWQSIYPPHTKFNTVSDFCWIIAHMRDLKKEPRPAPLVFFPDRKDGHGPDWKNPYAVLCSDCLLSQIPLMQDAIDKHFERGKYSIPLEQQYEKIRILDDFELPKGGLFS